MAKQNSNIATKQRSTWHSPNNSQIQNKRKEMHKKIHNLKKLRREKGIKKAITSTMSTPGIIGLSGKCPGKKLSLMVTFLIATAETPGLYSITLSTKRNGNLKRKPKWEIHQNFKLHSVFLIPLSHYEDY